jgi:hypothetical protein
VNYCSHTPYLTRSLVQVGTCSGFQAILLANLKLSRGLATTGVGALGCRHKFWQLQSVINLQKGEQLVTRRLLSLTRH